MFAVMVVSQTSATDGLRKGWGIWRLPCAVSHRLLILPFANELAEPHEEAQDYFWGSRKQ